MFTITGMDIYYISLLKAPSNLTLPHLCATSSTVSPALAGCTAKGKPEFSALLAFTKSFFIPQQGFTHPSILHIAESTTDYGMWPCHRSPHNTNHRLATFSSSTTGIVDEQKKNKNSPEANNC